MIKEKVKFVHLNKKNHWQSLIKKYVTYFASRPRYNGVY